jgi:hypothetical protein
VRDRRVNHTADQYLNTGARQNGPEREVRGCAENVAVKDLSACVGGCVAGQEKDDKHNKDRDEKRGVAQRVFVCGSLKKSWSRNFSRRRLNGMREGCHEAEKEKDSCAPDFTNVG